MKKERWAFRLAPQLVGKAQQAYAGMSVADAGDYEKLKAAVLRRYDITEESYRQRFRSATLKDGESVTESLARIEDLAGKWMKSAKSRDEVVDLVLMEQLLTMLPENVRLFVKERKPKTSAEASKLADDYIVARKEDATNAKGRDSEEKQNPEKRSSAPRWNKGRRNGYQPRDGRQGQVKTEPEKTTPKRPRKDLRNLECFNCHERGHYAFQCPKDAHFCKVSRETEEVAHSVNVKRKGVVEGTPVERILLDTGCSKTLVRQDLIPKKKILDGEAVTIRCAHGDTVLYPVAQVQVVVDGSETLPMDVLLGKDVPEFYELLNGACSQGRSQDDAMVVMTRAQRRKQKEEEEEIHRKEMKSGAKSTRIDEWMQTFADEVFEGGRERVKQTRSQKRQQRRAHAEEITADLEETVDTDQSQVTALHPLDISAGELKVLQAADTTLDSVRKEADGNPGDSSEVGYFWKDGLLFRKWIPRGYEEQDMAVEQLVLPMQCRNTVLQLAHDIPLSGHLGKKKTTQRLLQRFYWPTIHRDVAEYCRTCDVCQKMTRQKARRVPMIPLPIIEEPFSRIAMDIVGPLPKSRSGKRYILVICDYATRYPEAVALRFTDAECIAEELVTVFSRVGVPREILTDQGSNFTSQLLKGSTAFCIFSQSVHHHTIHRQMGWWRDLTRL